jgi:hypothetical protein
LHRQHHDPLPTVGRDVVVALQAGMNRAVDRQRNRRAERETLPCVDVDHEDLVQAEIVKDELLAVGRPHRRSCAAV